MIRFHPFQMIIFLISVLNAFSTDYALLHQTVHSYVSTHLDQIPPLVRLSFHDLMNYDPATDIGGPRGCIRQEPQRNMSQNNHLQEPTDKLFEYVRKKVNTTFSDGDIISMAGKVSIEISFCVQIDWNGGRQECTETEPEAGPPGTINTIKDLQPFLKRYNFTVNEMGILIAGAHAVKGSRGRLNTPQPMFFSTVNSGAQWIKDTIAIGWAYFGSVQDPGFKGSGLLRLPVDMLFFPRSVEETIVGSSNIGKPVVDVEAKPVERYLIPFAYKPDADFNKEFARVFSKMLEIGTKDLIPFNQTTVSC